jgi:hypothetical protein
MMYLEMQGKMHLKLDKTIIVNTMVCIVTNIGV